MVQGPIWLPSIRRSPADPSCINSPSTEESEQAVDP
jgi:hypothetical protein